jgi:hypothetical protein
MAGQTGIRIKDRSVVGMGIVYWEFADNGTPYTLRTAVAACAASTGGLKAILV